MTTSSNNDRRPTTTPRSFRPQDPTNLGYLTRERQYSEEDLQNLVAACSSVIGLPEGVQWGFNNIGRALACVRFVLVIAGVQAKQAIALGIDPDEAWKEYDDILQLARTLGTPRELEEEQPTQQQPTSTRPARPAPRHERPVRQCIADTKGGDRLKALSEQLAITEASQAAAVEQPDAPQRQGLPGPAEQPDAPKKGKRRMTLKQKKAASAAAAEAGNGSERILLNAVPAPNSEAPASLQ